MNKNCGAKFIEMYLKIREDKVYVQFTFCCEQQIPIAEYPIEYVCENIDKCYNDVFNKAAELEICYDCNKYDGFDIRDISLFEFHNATSHICTQNCKFCGIMLTGKRFDPKKYNWCSDKLLEAVSKSKTIKIFSPTLSGEPFEDPYIKNVFLFNVHNSNIKILDILTNAVHVDKEYLIKLRDYYEKHNIKIGFSINCSGFTKEIYESYCTSKFETVKKNIKNIYEIFHNSKIFAYISINYITSTHNMHLTRDEIYKQFKESFPFLNSINLRKSLDYTLVLKNKKEISEEISKKIYNKDDKDDIYLIDFANNGKLSKFDIYRRYNKIMSEKQNECLDNSIQLFVRKINGEVFISFVFCCELSIELLTYPLEDVCKDFDKYFDKALEILKESKLCHKCEHYTGFDMGDPKSYIITNGSSLICSQKCTYCGSCDVHTPNKVKEYCSYSNKLLNAISNSKHVINVVPSCQGEPFEDPYIRNEFLFNLHNSNIKHINFLTNASHATKEYIDKLSKYFKDNDIDATFLINCAGFTKEIYESYCTSKFEKVVSNIENLVNTFGNNNITILYIISMHNYFIKKSEVIEQFKKTFPYLDPNKNLRIIMDWKNWKDSERIKLNAEFCDAPDKSVGYKLKNYIYDSFLPKIQEWR